MIKLAHIAPTNCTAEAIEASDMNMVLAHVAANDEQYARLFEMSDKYTLLDNGAFENGFPMSPEQMIEIGTNVAADCLVLPDYPHKDWRQGWFKIADALGMYRRAGFKSMFIPQSEYLDEVGFYKSLEQALEHPGIDRIGLSILGCPNAGLLRKDILEKYKNWSAAKGRFHILGMLGTVDEIAELKPYEHMIHGWDTSAAVWYGVNFISVEDRRVKYDVSVDFNSILDWNDIVTDNINYMRSMV